MLDLFTRPWFRLRLEDSTEIHGTQTTDGSLKLTIDNPWMEIRLQLSKKDVASLYDWLTKSGYGQVGKVISIDKRNS